VSLGTSSAEPLIKVNAILRQMVQLLDALAQRATDLKKLADPWQPWYQTLNQDQKRRMAAPTIYVLREMRSAAEDRHLQAEGDDEQSRRGRSG
jgi:hypothetical protein